MKINLKIILYSIAMIATAFSCLDDDLNGLDPLEKPVASSSITSLSLNEGENGVIPFTISTPINKVSQFKIEVINGDADQLEDFFVGDQRTDGDTGIANEGFEITVPAYSESFDIPVQAIMDIYPEMEENVTLEISAAGVRTVLITNEKHRVDLNIVNTVEDTFVFNLEWDTEYIGLDGESHSTCDFDFDLEIYTAAFGGPLLTSYSDCPEQITINPGDLADGNYWLVPSFWDVSTGVAPEVDFNVPAKLTFAKPGVYVETIDLTELWDTASGGNQQGNPDAYLVKYILTVDGTTYTITDNDTGNPVVSGKMTSTRDNNTSVFVGGRQQ